MAGKKPSLKVVCSTPPDPSAPPPVLREHGRELWRRVMSEYQIEDSGGREMLAQACMAADRAAECAEAIAHDGAVINTKHGLRDHPLLKHELAARSFVVRTLGRLGLDVEAVRSSPGRPTRGW